MSLKTTKKEGGRKGVGGGTKLKEKAFLKDQLQAFLGLHPEVDSSRWEFGPYKVKRTNRASWEMGAWGHA